MAVVWTLLHMHGGGIWFRAISLLKTEWASLSGGMVVQRQLNARLLAAQVLVKVDEAGSYANIELDKALRRSALAERDRALATELVYGTLRWRGQIDAAVNAASTRPIAKMSPKVRNILRLTAYQLMHLTHIPGHAAVDEAVTITKEMGEASAAGFVNAVARRVAREGPPPMYPDAENASDLAAAWSHPVWLVERWLHTYGPALTRAILNANQSPAPMVIRVNTLRISRSNYMATLDQAGVPAHIGRTPYAIVVEGGVGATSLPGYDQGWFVVQDESSQLVAHALAPHPNEQVADLCSAPGGKATHLAQLMDDQGQIIAQELHPHRVKLIADTVQRLGMRSVQAIKGDSRQVPTEWQGRFNRVLLDAPCMGTGVLRRRVDLRWRLQRADLAQLATLQTELLDAAASLVKLGGRLVYSTCSLEPEENSDRVVAFLKRHQEFRAGSLMHLEQVAPELAYPPRHPEMANGYLQLLPEATSDGFFLASLEKTN